MTFHTIKPIKKSTNSGFTLIEMLVAVTIFSLIIGSATGLFVSAIRSQINALVAQKLSDETSYVMEYMSRALRMAKKNIDETCSVVDLCQACNYSNPAGDDSIMFVSYQYECSGFFQAVNLLYKEPGSLPLTSSDFEIPVGNLKFHLSGQAQTDNLQPRVTILMTIRKAEAAKPEIRIQTTISQRNLDIQQ